jgi:hypothetical protein
MEEPKMSFFGKKEPEPIYKIYRYGPQFKGSATPIWVGTDRCEAEREFEIHRLSYPELTCALHKVTIGSCGEVVVDVLKTKDGHEYKIENPFAAECDPAYQKVSAYGPEASDSACYTVPVVIYAKSQADAHASVMEFVSEYFKLKALVKAMDTGNCPLIPSRRNR